MNINTIEAIKAAVSKLNCRGAIVITVDDSKKQGQIFYSCQIKVHEGKENLLSYLESLSRLLGQLNGESLFIEISTPKRSVFLT